MTKHLLFFSQGLKYLKTGDESGNLCRRCDLPMIVEKRGTTVKDENGKEVHKKGWYEYCRCCGREVKLDNVESAYV